MSARPSIDGIARLPLRKVIVRAETGWKLPDLVEAWHYRELFWVLAERDIKVRYKQTVLGVAWAIVQPLVTMVVFSMISRFGAISTDGIRPEVFYFCGMLPWLLFANSLTSAGTSLVGSQHLTSKVYFPRLIIPAASVITALIDFAIAFVVLLARASDRIIARVHRTRVSGFARLRALAGRAHRPIQRRPSHCAVRHPGLAVLYPRPLLVDVRSRAMESCAARPQSAVARRRGGPLVRARSAVARTRDLRVGGDHCRRLRGIPVLFP
jgi:hypothetical protein